MPKRVAARVGRRGFALFVFGLVFLSSAVQMLSPDIPMAQNQLDGLRILTRWVPLAFWGWSMAVAGVVCWLGVAFKRLEALAFASASGLYCMFGLGYALAIHGALFPFSVFRAALVNISIAFFVVVVSRWEE